MSVKRLYLIDATAFCYRAFYALKELSTSFGQPTNAIYGFVSMLNKILKENKPEFLAVCFDVSRETFRQKKFAEYKVNRPPMPDGLSSQLPLIKEVVSAYGISMIEKEGFEADDLIATLAREAKDKGFQVTAVTSDKDMLQLVDEDVAVFSPYKEGGTLYDRDKVRERFEINPEQIPDLLALMGDATDNIPSVPGIGEKTAVSLISSFGRVEKLLANLDKVGNEKIRSSLKENTERVRLNKELVSLDSRVEIGFSQEKLKIKDPDYKELFRLFKYLEFKSLLKGLPSGGKRSILPQFQELDDARLKDFPKEGELVVFAPSLKEFYLRVQGEFFHVPEAGPLLKRILSDRGIGKSGHALKELKIMLEKNNISFEGLSFDTKIASYLLDPARSDYGIYGLALDYLGESLDNADSDIRRQIALIPALKEKLDKELEEKELIKLFEELEMPLVEVLADMELEGIRLDLEFLKTISRDIEKRLIKLIDEIYQESGTQFNINSPKQLREILFEKLKLPVVKRSKTGPSTDEEVLKKLADKHALPAKLLEYRQLFKLKTTYIDALPELVDKKTGKIHASFNQTGTETGRLSSSNPNLQNIPIKTEIGSKIRKAIIASKDDNRLLSCDYSQIELRILAHLSKEENLIISFKNHEDLHKATASLIYGINEKDVTEEMREVAKRVNFGIIYGQTSFGLSKDLGITFDEAQHFIDAYFLRYPRVKEYLEEQVSKAQEDGFVTTILGRRRYIPQIRDKNQGIRQFAQRQAVNAPIQGSASDLIKLAMVKIYQRLKEEKLKARMVLQIHDELVFDVPTQEVKRLAGVVKERMENVMELEVPIKVEMKIGKNWLEMEEVK